MKLAYQFSKTNGVLVPSLQEQLEYLSAYDGGVHIPNPSFNMLEGIAMMMAVDGHLALEGVRTAGTLRLLTTQSSTWEES